MDVVFDLALMAHLLSLLAAGASVIAMPLIGTRMASAPPETRAALGGMARQLGIYSRVAFGVLLVSGPLMLWLRYGGIGGASVWFWVKMALIVVMAAGMAANGYFRRRAAAGDGPAFAAAKAASNLSRLALLGIIVAAVLAFN